MLAAGRRPRCYIAACYGDPQEEQQEPAGAEPRVRRAEPCRHRVLHGHDLPAGAHVRGEAAAAPLPRRLRPASPPKALGAGQRGRVVPDALGVAGWAAGRCGCPSARVSASQRTCPPARALPWRRGSRPSRPSRARGEEPRPHPPRVRRSQRG